MPQTTTISRRKRSAVDSHPFPTLEEVLEMEEIGTLRIENATQGHEEFEEGDQVFVVPANVILTEDTRPLDPHKYWKMRIDSMHMDEDDKCWVVGTWFYSPSEVADLPSLKKDHRPILAMLGDTELLESDHQQVFDPGCIESLAKVHKFNDTDSLAPMITAQSWFSRLTVTVTVSNQAKISVLSPFVIIFSYETVDVDFRECTYTAFAKRCTAPSRIFSASATVVKSGLIRDA
ncbi:hypothetical protein M413DRAFT_13427 [Hebeloma cylindrosporum]|uniref:BAH domain-containing protein n=1 Tax=Hebeloma cylindrosporum TaxID=76867 RepID=A0A0C3C0Q4_HEBCY|nr:hypothetical protein M413DRAFT_13427 [Hebeloma cylindrosporum h7]